MTDSMAHELRAARRIVEHVAYRMIGIALRRKYWSIWKNYQCKAVVIQRGLRLLELAEAA